MRIAFFGLPLAALLLERDGHDVVLAAVSRPEAVGMRRLVRLLGTERVLRKPDVASQALHDAVRRSRPHLVVSWFWTTRIPTRIVALAPLGGFGVHPSLLPRHRGPDPYFWAIEEGDVETGATAHRIAEAYDTGAILGRRRLRIDPSWSAWTLARKLDRPALALLRETARAFAAGSPPAEEPQDETLATYAPEPDESQLALRWSATAAGVVRRVRAASPWPGAFTEIGDALVVVTKARVTRAFPRALAPGEAAVRDGVAVVRASDEAVELLEGRDETERPLDSASLAAMVRAAASG